MAHVMSYYKFADMKIKLDQMEFLEKRGIGTNAARKSIQGAAWLAYFDETGLDLWTHKEPKPADKEWAEAELKKQSSARQIS